MAYAALVSLAQLLEQILFSDQQSNVIDHEKEQIKTLRENIIFLTTSLEDFPGEFCDLEARITTAANQAEDIIEYHISEQLSSKYGMRFRKNGTSFRKEAHDLEARITTAANRAEDIIEYHISKQLSSKHGLRLRKNEMRFRKNEMHFRQVKLSLPSNQPAGHRISLSLPSFRNVLNCFRQVKLSPPCTQPAGHQSLYRKLHKSVKEIDSILKEVTQSKSSRVKDPRSNHSLGSTSSSSRLPPEGKDAMVGFQEHLIEVKAWLCGESSKLQIIPIVGMGGIGKTTLAKYAHDDPLIVHHFDFRAWVTVSQNYDARRILLGFMHYADASNKGKYEVMSNESLEENLYKYLKGRRYLIVMDDMWNTNAWDEIRRILPDDSNGSRVIITTRELNVAYYADSSSHPYQMQLMNVDQSWRLLRQKVFGREHCPPNLENIGRLIAKNCKGLPLAIVVIAGVLSKVDQMQDTWKDIARNVNEAVNTSDEQFLEILSLSYTHLPRDLRPCFLYMGGFPEAHEIKVSKLIRLWIGEGFLRSNGSRDLEELAEEHLEELVKRSLIVVIKKRSNGKIKAVKIHDLLRDLCLNKARDENFLHVINEFSSSFEKTFQNSRRFSILPKITRGFPDIYGSPVHTILLFHCNAIYHWESFKLLRVMDAMDVKLDSYPVEISVLFHLRYLALSFSDNSCDWSIEIPGLLSKLQNLQTLILDHYDLSLPVEIWRMPQLRHLIMGRGFIPEPRIGMLASLHTLVGVTGFSCSRRICKMIPNLKKLELIYSSGDIREIGWYEYYLQNLEKLKIYTDLYDKHSLSQNVAFPRTLKKLTLQNCRFRWKDMHNIGSLPNLEVLKLLYHACEGVKWETTEGEFCQLKVLLIDRTRLYEWITESDHFPRLERLVLYDCHRLREIPQCVGDIPTLQLIEVNLSNSSIVESAKRIEEEQQSYGNNLLQVHLLRSRHWKLSKSYR